MRLQALRQPVSKIFQQARPPPRMQLRARSRVDCVLAGGRARRTRACGHTYNISEKSMVSGALAAVLRAWKGGFRGPWWGLKAGGEEAVAAAKGALGEARRRRRGGCGRVRWCARDGGWMLVDDYICAGVTTTGEARVERSVPRGSGHDHRRQVGAGARGRGLAGKVEPDGRAARATTSPEARGRFFA